MVKCSSQAYEKCKGKCYHCRTEEDAYFIEGSDCDKFNQEVAGNKRSPCETCMKSTNPSECQRKGCVAWRAWWLKRWDQIHNYGERQKA